MIKRLKDIPKFISKVWDIAFPLDTEKKRQRRIKKARKDPAYFAQTYLPHYVRAPFAKFHKELFKLATSKKKGKRIAVAAPRAHAKSTILSLIFPLWCIVTGRMGFIVIVSDSFAQAYLHLGAIINELEQNEKLRKDFGNLVGSEKWTQSEILTTTGIRVMAKGTGSKLRGLRSFAIRPDLVICDDLENDELVSTLEQRKKIYSWFTKSLSNVFGADDSQLIVIGTIIHYDSILAKLLNNPAYKSLFYRAIQKNGKPLWLEVWTLEKLEEKKKEIGTLAFNSEYMNNPIDEETQIFKHSWIKKYKDEDIKDLNLSIYGALDPAISKKETADYSAFITIGVADDGRIFVLDADLCRLSPKALIGKLFNKFARYRHLLIALETVAFQDVLLRWIEDISCEKKVFLPIKEVKHYSDKVRRITRLSPLFEKELIYVKEEHELLIDQLEHFPRAAHDDGPDSLEMAVDIARQKVVFIDHIEEPVQDGVFGGI